jgi:hypothetical protein
MQHEKRNYLTRDEEQLGDWATAPLPQVYVGPPSEFWRWVKDQIPGLLNTIAALREAQGIVPDREGLRHPDEVI